MKTVSSDERVFTSEVWEDPQAGRCTFYCRELLASFLLDEQRQKRDAP